MRRNPPFDGAPMRRNVTKRTFCHLSCPDGEGVRDFDPRSVPVLTCSKSAFWFFGDGGLLSSFAFSPE